MAYCEQLADRIRIAFAEFSNVEEKAMMGGLAFMLNGKMCVGIFKGELMCRIDPAETDAALEQPGCRQMELGGKAMKGYVLIDEVGMRSKKDFSRWVGMAIAFNKHAKASKKKKKN